MTAEEIKALDQDINYTISVYFNPKIRVMRGCQVFYEGCMSVPNAAGRVKRPYYIEIDAQDINGNYIHKTASGFEAIVLCHEIDHLDGIEYTDKATNIHYNIDIEERLQLRRDHPHEVILEDGKFDQEELPINIRTKIYN
jgi:peptide deformylase